MAFQPVSASHTAGFAQPTIRYDLKVGPSTLGKATLWCEGVSEEPGDPRIFDVELEIYNATKDPIRLDVEQSRVMASTHKRHRESLGRPSAWSGSEAIAPYFASRVGLRFPLPRSLSTSDVEEFEFVWRLESPAGNYGQSTRFAAVAPSQVDSDERVRASVGGFGFDTSDDYDDYKDTYTLITR
jgi:hypothetical protein